MSIHTEEIAIKLLQKNILNDPTLSISDLFFIRDCCMGLARYSLHDQSLLNEVLRYIGEKVGE